MAVVFSISEVKNIFTRFLFFFFFFAFAYGDNSDARKYLD